MSLKIHRLNPFQQFLTLYPRPICPKKLQIYFSALDELTLSRIRRLRKFIYISSDFAKEEVIKCVDAIAKHNPGSFSKSHIAMLLLSSELHNIQGKN